MDESSQDKNLPASGRKLQKAREQGQIARSRDLGHLAVLGGGVFVLALTGVQMFAGLKVLLAAQLSFNAASVANAQTMGDRLGAVVKAALAGYLPLGLAVMAAAALAAIAAGGWVVTFVPLMPDASRISPMAGLKRLFSGQQAAETAKLVALMAVMGAVAAFFFAGQAKPMVALLQQSLPAALDGLAQTLLAGAAVLAGVVAAVAALDVPLQSYLHAARLRMSHQEARQEQKESDGDPQVKGRRRALQRELSRRAGVQAVREADLVVMNPTHYAVALKYDERTMRAPRVVAKGADLIAMRIRDMAGAFSVPVLQAPMLARALYAHAEVDQEVPSALYTAVAQVLAYVYQLKAAMRGEGAQPPQFTAPTVPPELDPHTRASKG